MRASVTVRPADLDGPDRAAVASMLTAYHAQTEREKVERGLAEPGPLPERYAVEVRDPVRSFDGAVVLVAERDEAAIGMVVMHRAGSDVELERLWVAPAGRRSGAGSALLTDAAERARALGAAGLRLSVWNWRADALALYAREGLVEAPSWESRAQLVCLRLPL
ncbi:GNAT family N-acetyltransferase [Microbacterium sp. CnD16-F]|uniref:GNAT family N-acetyltransferase n=1 Tax=unclassified Microbacterium TaxID=2609290 RepID=UPI002097657F|nr:GNAT family N-acetyltransferase [Microbacterium sp. CnD16-F]MCO7204778.1 GNAT family N-acetyltransferase [Microbacterium sp. CnD16-F]